MTLPANPWTLLGIGALAFIVWLAAMLPFWAILYAHGEHEATSIPAEVAE